MKRPGALTETSDDMFCEIVQSLNGLSVTRISK